MQLIIKLDDLGHEPDPTGLMAYAQPRAVVAEEVFVEEDVVVPVGITPRTSLYPQNGPLALFILEKYLCQPVGFANVVEWVFQG
jgi:hypothetical protein